MQTVYTAASTMKVLFKIMFLTFFLIGHVKLQEIDAEYSDVINDLFKDENEEETTTTPRTAITSTTTEPTTTTTKRAPTTTTEAPTTKKILKTSLAYTRTTPPSATPDIIYDESIFGSGSFSASTEPTIITTKRVPTITTEAPTTKKIMKTTQATKRITTERITTQSSPRATTEKEDDYGGVWDEPDICDEGQKCVPLSLCQNGLIETSGKYLIDPRAELSLTKPAKTCPTLQTCCEKVGYIKPPVNLCTGHFKIPSECGVRNEKGIGTEALSMDNKTLYAQYAEFPWTMAIMKEIINEDGNKEEKFHCGGSLFHLKVVLTTAHNLQGLSRQKMFVRGGEWERKSRNEMCKHEDRRVERIVRHKEFNYVTYEHDIGLLFLVEPFERSAFINTICLPPKSESFVGTTCVASGWGKTKLEDQEPYQSFLKKVELKIVSNYDCNEKHSSLQEGVELPDSMLCAGGEKGVDTCKGDGGSALVCRKVSDPTRYCQIGIVVGGIGCGQEGVPGLYTDVAKHKDWIDHEIYDKEKIEFN